MASFVTSPKMVTARPKRSYTTCTKQTLADNAQISAVVAVNP